MREELTPRLQHLFDRELKRGQTRHIVFWYDANADYQNEVHDIHLDQVRILDGRTYGQFQMKYEIEAGNHDHLLLYFPYPQPEIQEDWLRDVYEYSMSFHMDHIAMLMEDLALEGEQLRAAFDRYNIFFRARDRREAFRKVAARLDIQREDDVDLAVMSAITKVDTIHFFSVVKHVASGEAEDENKAWSRLQKYGRADVFWDWTQRYFGYPLKGNKPSISGFIKSLLLTHASDEVGIAFPEKEAATPLDPVDCEVFINQWQNDPQYYQAYRTLANKYEQSDLVFKLLSSVSEEKLLHGDTFSFFDDTIIAYTIARLVEGGQNFNRYQQLITARRSTHWWDLYEDKYQAIEAAIALKAGVWSLEQEGLPYIKEELFDYYRNEGYRFDGNYRKFYTAYDQVQRRSSILDELKDEVEEIYHYFLNTLDFKWSDALAHEGGLEVGDVPSQNKFYTHFVRKLAKKQRVYVIISDAFRYALARDLSDQLNHQNKYAAELHAMVGQVPSYTPLGMASLLPHRTLAYQNNSYLVDGQPTNSTKAREAVLQQKQPDSMAITYSELQSLSKQALRERLRGQRIVYIYHNVVDNLGEQGPSEHQVLTAGDRAVEELEGLILRLFNTVSAGDFLVTADHGFIYTRDPLGERSKRPRDGLSGDLENHRFIVNDSSDREQGTLTFPFPAETDHPLYVHVPKGTTRFKVRGGGENYVHGGASLQELTIPVLHVQTSRKGRSEGDAPVNIQLTSLTRKLTNSVTYLDFLQSERVADRRRPARYLACFVSEEGTVVSNVVHIIADATNAQPQERVYKEKFVLAQGEHDQDTTYDLLVTYEDGTEYMRIPFAVDILPSI
ncbi:BREX-1 system phosphatase PglZ type A [Salicibibacter kimchii]|uniref:BREX-1 system phosphatase PglZ type A n=1 Tax=Salicibibacter kimchii TaxID=2099786 RepID=A0A345BXB4_9BACI|nr:BREX-1 system phosphatase PglZ type A [Salicibibacter kimchii]AXF55595.1 BREX-1 system phosphatase PglZ type A [Salicibibacter kimchii]